VDADLDLVLVSSLFMDDDVHDPAADQVQVYV
jgi:hypothetical protein